MEGKHIANHPHQHEQQQPKGMETSHNNDPHDKWVCRWCGWTYPNAHPSAKHRRNHKKHCGKIEGFKVIDTAKKELKGGSSDDDLSEDEHMSTVNNKMEGEHNTDHQHEQQQPKGMETSHNNDPHDKWVCRRCGWTYPNAHPSAKHRRNHKKLCGKIEGFKVIDTANKELKGGSSDDDLSEDEHMSTVNNKMEGEHYTDLQHQHEHLVQPAGIKTHHTKDDQHEYICHQCGWKYPNPYPGPKHRRNHRKHCGKIEGFKLITSEDRETQGGSSDEVSSDDEHKSIEHVEMEGKHISSHHLEREQKQHVPAGIETHQTKDPGDVCTCHRCGWRYPNAHPSAKHRRNHKKHCGKIEGFELISSGDRDTHGGSSEELSDDQHKSIDHENLDSQKDNSTIPQTRASAPKPDNNSSNLEIIGPDAKVSNLSSLHESAKEVSEAATGTITGLGLHGQIVSGTTELPKNSTGHDILSFKHESTSIFKEVLNRDNNQDASGPVEHQEFTVKGHHDYADLKIPNSKIDGRVLPLLGESIPSVVQPHPGSDDIGGCDLQIINEPVKDDPRVSKKQPHIPKDVKISFAKVQDPGKIELGKSATTTQAPIHHSKGIGSRKVGIASILSFKEANSDDLNDNSSSVEESRASAGKIIYKLAQINHQVSDGKTQDVSISEMKEQEMQNDMKITSDCSKGLSSILFSGAHSQKENPQSCTLEPQIEKLLQSSAITIDSSVTNLDLEGTGGVAHHPEANSTVAEGISKPEVYTESKNASPINGDSGSCREREKPQTFYNINSDKMLSLETNDTLIASGLVKQDTLKETEVPCSKDIDKTSGQKNDLQASSKVVIAVQDMSFVDGCLTESSEAAKKQEVEHSACVVSNLIDHDKNDFDRDYKKEDSTKQKSILSDMDVFKHEVESSACIFSSIDHDKNVFDPDCKKEDSREQKSTLSDMDVFKHDDANEIAQEKLNKTPAGEVVVDEKRAAPEFHLSESVDYSQEENTVEQNILVKLEDHVESMDISPLICGDTDKFRDEEKPESFHHKFSDGMLHLEEDKEKVIEDALFKQKPVKETCSKAVETTSCEKQDGQDSSMVFPDPGISCTDNPPTENSNAGEREEVKYRALSSSTIECGMTDCSPDCKVQNSTQGDITLSERGMHDDTKVIAVETLPKININEAISENSALESHQPKDMVDTDEEKSTVEQTISVKHGDYIESKHMSPSNDLSDSHRDESSSNSNIGNTEDILQPEADKSMITGSDLSKHAFLDEAKVPYSKGVERDIDQKLDLQTSSELVIPDHRMSLAGSCLVEDTKSGQMLSAECSGFTKMSIIESDLRDGDPGCKSKSSIQGNTVLPDVDMDGDIDSNIRPQEKFPKSSANDVDQESAALESVQSKTRDTDSRLQGDDHIDLKAEIRREGADCEGNEKGPEQSVIEQIEQLQADRVFVDKSCSPTKASSHLNGSIDNLENSSRESIDGVHGDKSKLMKNCEPALWEQLLETNVNKSINQETNQGHGNAGTSPGNPFIYENKLSNKEDVPETLAIEGRHGLISEQLENMFAVAESMPSTTNNRVEQDPVINTGNEGGGDMKAIHSKEKTPETSLMAPEDLFEAPSFMTLVESGNYSGQQLSHNEIQPKVKESNGELSADAEMASGTHERFHTPLRSLLAEENLRGTQEYSKPDPVLVFQPQTSSQNKIQVVQTSTVEVSDQTGTSSQKLTLPLKDINSSSKKLAEKVWNSPARLPSLKIEKQKVSKVKSAWTMCLCGCDTK
ncbi:uncharacterized protein LOC131036723 isoform X2 [Cryptomeria japonica]|uniref:uncharacterized protein LOC131036723 isoform X2 n=1 Tax=Cryptomeria japonica TaxID=3369 RepID=UPI0027DA8CC0|nr:uncharacterized protein LOC131036723 isoform X2 [Cryptomeria japonica]